MIPERAEYTFFDPEYIGPEHYMFIRRLNRTSFSMTFQFETLKDIEDAQVIFFKL